MGMLDSLPAGTTTPLDLVERLIHARTISDW